MQNTITARRLITDTGTIEFPVITLAADGTIADIFSDPIALAHETDTLTAAFFDVHTHGAIGYDVMQSTPAQLSELQRFLAGHGVAHYLPTTVTAPVDATLRALEALATLIESTPRENEAIPVGIHLEGPFLSHAKRGVHPPAELQPPSIELFDRFQTAARGHIKLVTIAPEPNAATPKGGVSREARPFSSDTAFDLIRHATGQNVRVSIGHSNATAAEALAAIDAGATTATHTFNAMRALDHREPGILGIVLDDNRLFAELICDGIHVAPPLVRLWLKAKGLDRAILITDSMSATGMPDGDYTLGGFTVTVKNSIAWLIEGERKSLAGSLLTLDRAVANLQTFTHTTIGDATRLASHNPAAMLGHPTLTRLAPGFPANLNRFNANDQLSATYIRGSKIDS
jgi:N-acetylglucosamine-6-phosphate deacetylase